MPYPKRLIEVDLPIKRISAHARREKSIRQGHIATLHIWWARRPLAACRAILCASLWPDPADEDCPEEFIEFAKKEMLKWSDNDHLQLLSKESIEHFIKVNHNSKLVDNKVFLRQLLLDFIADFANWDSGSQFDYLSTSKALTQSAHIALGGENGTIPLVVDPFAGGGSIPLEALRIGADVFASDLNPIPFILNKVQLQFLPKYGTKLGEKVMEYGTKIGADVQSELAEFYPNDSDGIETIAFFWARVIRCEGPSCGAEIPLLRSLWLAKKNRNSMALVLTKKGSKIEFKINYDAKPKDIQEGTVKKANATCPICGYTTQAESLRRQLREQNGGADHSRLIAVRYDDAKTGERTFRLATEKDHSIFKKAKEYLWKSELVNYLPVESLPKKGSLGFRVQNYGILLWWQLFNSRQLLSLALFSKKITELEKQITIVKGCRFC
ncbi:MAG: DUF1156 domain-containing protein [Cyclobacteriaceae bacterium]